MSCFKIYLKRRSILLWLNLPIGFLRRQSFITKMLYYHNIFRYHRTTGWCESYYNMGRLCRQLNGSENGEILDGLLMNSFIIDHFYFLKTLDFTTQIWVTDGCCVYTLLKVYWVIATIYMTFFKKQFFGL